MTKEGIILEHSEKAFSAEVSRASTLDDKAEKFTAAVAIVVGFHLVDINRFTLTGGVWVAVKTLVAVAALACLGGSLALALLSRRIQDYAGHPKGQEMIDELRDPGTNEDVASLLLADMYLNATEKNRLLNDHKAKWLSLSGWFLLGGFLLAVASALIAKLLA